MDMIHEELKLMNRQLEHKAEKDRLIDSMRFDYKRPNYRISHKCIVCSEIMTTDPYKKMLWNHIAHFECGKMARKFKKQKKHTLKTLLKMRGINVQ